MQQPIARPYLSNRALSVIKQQKIMKFAVQFRISGPLSHQNVYVAGEISPLESLHGMV